MTTNIASQSGGIYIPNYPPPPLPFALSHHDSSQVNHVNTFKERFEHFAAHRLAKIQNAHDASKQNLNKNLTLCYVTDEVRQCYALIDQIKIESASLMSENNRFSDNEWNEKMTILHEKQKRMMQLTEKYTNADIQAAIEMKLKRRQEKRARIRKRKKETSELHRLRIETRTEKHRVIDEWFQEAARTIEKERQRAQDDQRIEQILSDVKRKRSEAIKNINLMNSLIELHRVRRVQKLLNDRCEHELVDELKSLKTQWQSALATYTEEEQKLRKCTKSNDLYGEWHEVLFDAGDHTQSIEINSVQDVDDLIRIRSAWDAFIVAPSNVSGSSIPIGWVTPNANPSAEWKAYLSK